MIEGIYEDIINNKIIKELIFEDENFLIGKEKLDSEEAKILLSQYIAGVIKKALCYVREEKMEIDEI